MRIKLLISHAGTTYSHIPGDIVDWAEDAARAYIAKGYAVEHVDAITEPQREDERLLLNGDPSAPAPKGVLRGADLVKGKKR